jgi:hypothetical protein
MPRRLPSLHGVLPSSVSPLPWYCEGAPTPACPSRRACCGRAAIPRVATSVSLPSVLGAQPGAWKFRVRHSPADFSVETSRSPRFLGNPSVRSPGSSTPAGPAPLALTGITDAAPGLLDGRGSRDNMHFGAQSPGSRTRCLRFAGWVAPPPRKTRFRLLARLCRMGFLPTGFQRKVSEVISSSFPKLRLAQPTWHRRDLAPLPNAQPRPPAVPGYPPRCAV